MATSRIPICDYYMRPHYLLVSGLERIMIYKLTCTASDIVVHIVKLGNSGLQYIKYYSLIVNNLNGLLIIREDE